MTIEEVKDALVEIISTYFPTTQIVWAEQRKLVKPSGTFIQLKLRNLGASLHSIKETENDVLCGYKPSKTMLEVQLFTRGATKTFVEDGEKAKVSVNTALNDIMELTNFLTSEYADAFYEKYDICVRPEGEAQDASGLVDTSYEYRAMQEYVVEFVQIVQGYAGISRDDWKPTASGGGTEELANSEIPELDAGSIEITNNS